MAPAKLDQSAPTTSDRLKTAVVETARHHLRPLALIELAAFTVALLLGWTEIALAILAWHVLRMGAMAVRDFRGHRDDQSGVG
jgi:hypothetical protein